MLRASFYTCHCMGAPDRCCTCDTCGSLVVSDQNQIGSPTRSRMRRSVMVRSSAAKPVSWISDSLYGATAFELWAQCYPPAARWPTRARCKRDCALLPADSKANQFTLFSDACFGQDFAQTGNWNRWRCVSIHAADRVRLQQRIVDGFFSGFSNRFEERRKSIFG